jgi:tetratricopeptide (TPR) repeat protein
MELRDGHIPEGTALLEKMLADDPSRRDALVILGCSIAEVNPDAGYECIEVAARTAIAADEWGSAAAALNEFVNRVPNHIPALMRLVEICVDGGLEATMYGAQGQLADAYIAAGLAAEARFIAEDLVAREPWERANIERFRRTLVLIGEPDPDALIADRLSGQTPFTSTDLSLGSDDLPPFDTSVAVPAGPPPPAATPAPAARTPVNLNPASPGSVVKPDGKTKGRDQFELSTNAVDFQSLMDEFESPPSARAWTESVEVDLSIVLGEIKQPAAAPDTPAKPAGDIDDVFAQLRTEASRRTALEAADEEYKRGVALHRAGKIDECIPALQAASRAPRLRFATASLLGRIFRARGMATEAIESFERAAEAPAPTPEEGNELLYDLADALEKTGETARALAICMELHAEVGDYRDISVRIERLSKVQSRG